MRVLVYPHELAIGGSQINAIDLAAEIRTLGHEAIVYEAEADTFRVDMAKVEDAVRDLAARFLIVEGDGDYLKAAQFLDKYGILDAFTENALKKLADIPVDIAPSFPLDF